MVRAVNLSAEIPAQRAAHKYIRWKMFLCGDARDRHCRGQPIGRKLTKPSRIFVSPKTGDRPCNGGVLRWKRRSSIKKIPVPIPHVRSFTLSNFFEKISNRSRVDGSLTA